MTTPKPSANIKRHVTRSGADVTAHTNPAPVRPELAFSLRLSISSDESSSLAVQRRACRAQAVALGLDPDTAVEYIDEDVSGASALESRTEGMARILVDRPRVVIAWKLDRFARSVSEFLKLVTWSEEHGVALATADGALNTSTPGGRLVATILGGSRPVGAGDDPGPCHGGARGATGTGPMDRRSRTLPVRDGTPGRKGVPR